MGEYSLPICRATHNQEHHGTGSWAWRHRAALSSRLPNVSLTYQHQGMPVIFVFPGCKAQSFTERRPGEKPSSG